MPTMSSYASSPPSRPVRDLPTTLHDLRVSLALLITGAALWTLVVVAQLLAPPVGEEDVFLRLVVGSAGVALTWMGAIFGVWNWSIFRRLRALPHGLPLPTRGLPPPSGAPPPPPSSFPTPPQ